jgi:hypothetical protein
VTPNVPARARVFVRRGPQTGGVVDVHVHFPPGLVGCQEFSFDVDAGIGCRYREMTPENAPTHHELGVALTTMFELLAPTGLVAGATTYHFEADAPVDLYLVEDAADLVRRARGGGLHLFLAGDVGSGLAAQNLWTNSVPGALGVDGTAGSGVVVTLQGDGAFAHSLTGRYAARAVLRLLGVPPTTSVAGDDDLYTDTPVCTAAKLADAPDACPDVQYASFPRPVELPTPQRQDVYSTAQRATLLASPLQR